MPLHLMEAVITYWVLLSLVVLALVVQGSVVAPSRPASSPSIAHGFVPSMPSSDPRQKPPDIIAPVPFASPLPHRVPQNPPGILPSIPQNQTPNAHLSSAPETKSPASMPIGPTGTVPVASPLRNSERYPLISHSVNPRMTPSYFPVPMTSPPSKPPPDFSESHHLTSNEATISVPGPSFSATSFPPPLSHRHERNGILIFAPPNEVQSQSSPPKQRTTEVPFWHPARKHSAAASAHSPPHFKSHPNKGFNSPVSYPSTFFNKHHHGNNKISSPASAPLPLSWTPASKRRDSWKRHDAPLALNPVSHVSPSCEPSPSPASLSSYSKVHFPFPRTSPSGSPSRKPDTAFLPPLRGISPPPLDEDCTAIVCTDPLTNTPPGSPCGCVRPMQVVLLLSVELLTFFPLVSELSVEIGTGVYMKQSQIRIIGANAAAQQPEKTIVLIDLVPLGEKFDNITTFLTYQRFWKKQVIINSSLFGDYEVLYVHYPGLPTASPMSPSDITIEDDGPYSGQGNNGRTMHPLGVDVQRKGRAGGHHGSMIAIIVLSASIAIVLCSAAAWVFLSKNRDRVCKAVLSSGLHPSLTRSEGDAGSRFGSAPSSGLLSLESSITVYAGSARTFSSSDIERATDNFDPSRIVGEGGFGRVYSGVLKDETKVAVKVLKRDDQQGSQEFLAEVEMLSRLHHKNLVKLIGICIEERARCLVYELIPNGSVESHLHGVDKETAPLLWSARIKIALGAAQGLAYLHEDSSPHVIHRDFKSSNILLQHDFTAKVSDFGLARTAIDGVHQHISTRVMGTFGYVAPEYAMTGHLLVKSDVYSYGVVLLELLTGRKPVDMTQPPGEENLVTWARPLLASKEGLESIVDHSLGPDYPLDSLAQVAAIASMCVQPEVSHRPFMGEVVQALKLVCNECSETGEVESPKCTRDDLSIESDIEAGTGSGWLPPDPFLPQHSAPHYGSRIDAKVGLPTSELFETSRGFGRQASALFGQHSGSGPLRMGKGSRFWRAMRGVSRGSVSEHPEMFRSLS